MQVEWRSPQFTVDGRIDCEINHPLHGWIPFTVDPTDAGAPFDAAALDAEIRATGNVAAYVPPPEPTAEELLAAERAGMVCSRFQAKAALMGAGLLASAEAAVAQADPVAQLAWAEAVEFRRTSPTIIALAAVLELTDEQIDDLFRAAVEISA
jgi:hypothetical protein